MKKYLIVVMLIIYSIANAQEDMPGGAVITGGLDWSGDGQYLAVGTTGGVYIHRADDLSIIQIVDEALSVHTVDWSHDGYRLAYDDRENAAIIIYDFETQERRSLNVIDTDMLKTVNMRWSPDDTLIAFGEYFDDQNDGLFVVDVAEEKIITEVYVRDYIGYIVDVLVDWHPDGQYFFVARGENVLIWDAIRQQPASIWQFETTLETPYHDRIDTMKWDSTGTRLAGGRLAVMYVLNAETGTILDTLTMESGEEFYGMSWHPEEDKLAFIAHRWQENDTTLDDSVIVWDLSTGEVINLFDVVYSRDSGHTQNIVQWSPDGSKLASMSSDGRIIIWETENYEVIAEYDGYRSLVGDN